MTNYTIWNRISREETEITEQEAENIYKLASCHSGPYGYMGYEIDQTLYCYDDEKEENELIAVRHEGEWLIIPDNQVSFMEAELGFHEYDLEMIPKE